MTLSPRVLVLAGGLSHERDVSQRSGRRVADALRDAGCEVTVSDVEAGLMGELTRGGFDVVWPLLHGASGEDGTLPDVLELVGIPFVGASASACRTAWDKSVAKTILRGAGLRTPEAVALPQGAFRELGAGDVLAAIVHRLGLPLVVKPARGGSALGMSVVRDAEQLPRAMVDCFAYGDLALIERYVEGVELAVSVLEDGSGPLALPAVEIVADGGVYDYHARYTAGATEFFCPARVPAEVAAAAHDAGVLAHKAFQLRHISRTDLIVDTDGVPWVLEVNVAPGMTETSLLPQSVLATGRSLAEVYRQLVERALSGAQDAAARP